MSNLPRIARYDGHLSFRAQQGLEDKSALVICKKFHDEEEWIIERLGKPDFGLGNSFSAAKQAIDALINSERARGAGEKK
jgi:hypothetical protein